MEYKNTEGYVRESKLLQIQSIHCICNEEDYETSQKHYERLWKSFWQYEDQCKKFFVLHFRPYIPIPQYWPWVSCIYDIIRLLNCLVKSPTFRILFKKSLEFTSALTISCYDIIFYMHTQHMFTHNIWRGKVFWCRFRGNLKLLS